MKKILSVLVSIVMLFSLSFSSLAFATTDGEALNVMTFHKGLKTADIANKAVLSINYSDLNDLSGMAKEIVDSGTMIYILNPEVSAEAIADLLSIPKTNVTSYQNLLLMAYSIYELDGKYVFANHYAAFAHEGESNEGLDNASLYSIDEIDAPFDVSEALTGSNFSNAFLVSDYSKQRLNGTPTIDPRDAISTAISAKRDMEAMSKNIVSDLGAEVAAIVQPDSTTFPSVIATATWNDTLNVYGLNNTYYGYLNCTVYGYGKGTGVVNGSNRRIYDVVSVVKAYPQSGYTVSRYETLIHCNIVDFSNLQTTTIPSGTSYSQGLSLTGSYGSSGGSGGGTFTTSWTYNPESQTITETSSTPRIVKWRAEPSNPQSGKAYDIAPGMRVACPTNKMRGAFTDIYCNAMILGITIHANSLEVGGWF